MNRAREEILKELKGTQLTMPDVPDFKTPVHRSIESPLNLPFKESLEKVNGSVHLFDTENGLFSELKQLLKNYSKENICCREPEIQQLLEEHNISFSECAELNENIEAGITSCESLIAHTGSIMVSSFQAGGRQMFIYPPVHIVLANKNQLVEYLEDAYIEIINKYKNNLPSQITLITGPSRTADIEKTLILGAHGPKELHVFLV